MELQVKNFKEQEHYYHIIPNDLIVTFKQVSQQQMYNNEDGGIIRKVIVKQKKMQRSSVEPYNDPEFKIPESNQYIIVRAYSLYKKQIPLFPQDQQRSSYIEPQKQYNSFIAESGIVSFDYLRTLFITQNINKFGYYEYFIKRNGQYYLQTCDDYIPILKSTRTPFWSLSLEHPWQIILFKAWLKQCGSFSNIFKAQPFSLLDTFGLPAYQLLNFRKELNFIKNERESQEKKKQKQYNLPLNKTDVLIFAKSINDTRVQKVGLLPNLAGFRILKISKFYQQPYFRVFSNLPCHWVGQYSPILNTNLNRIHYLQMFLDLQRNFLMSQQQILKYFNQFYVVPYQMSQPQRIITQDCINVISVNKKPTWIQFSVKSQQGLLSISILLPRIKNTMNKYPDFKYFLSKKKIPPEAISSKSNGQVQKNQEINQENTCNKWDCYGIDCIHGYHNSTAFFCRAVQGQYMLYINANGYNGPYNIRIDAQVQISKPQLINPSLQLMKQIFDSTFFDISLDLGLEASLNSRTFQQSISINNSFDQLGFGSVTINTLPNTKKQVAMKIFPQKLRQKGYNLLQHDEILQKGLSEQKRYLYISQKGKPQIVVLQKNEEKCQSTLGNAFPPQGTIQFFKIQPLSINNKNKNKR